MYISTPPKKRVHLVGVENGGKRGVERPKRGSSGWGVPVPRRRRASGRLLGIQSDPDAEAIRAQAEVQ